jgi:hypothetical protein
MIAQTNQRNNSAVQFQKDGHSNRPVSDALIFSRRSMSEKQWDAIDRQLMSFFSFEDDWDGMGSVAPERGVLEFSLFIADQHRKFDLPAPDTVMVSCNGTVIFEFAKNENEPLPVTSIEVLSGTLAELYSGSETIQRYALDSNRE